ncbi:diguanylate cyclase [Luteimonas sp. BDR2-5]|uniref:GGDEF domain-containing protein n=1 Tax=Proluteimonas luteida TaxID=2878685 RepID=UPI001E4AF6C7|nr:diguanylate cyclase [Luteimonas sp. BDR2-5]MCD9027034.1 diguanylate cyclase [Luteimonas sp. BDR2-5]
MTAPTGTRAAWVLLAAGWLLCAPPVSAQTVPAVSPDQAAVVRCERTMMSQPAEAKATAEGLLARSQLPADIRLLATACLANTEFVLGNGEAGEALTRQVLDLLQQPGISDRVHLTGQIRAATLLQRAGHSPEALDLLEQAQKRARAGGDTVQEINTLQMITYIRSDYFDDAAGALPYLQRAYDLDRSLNEQPPLAGVVLGYELGYLHLLLGDYDTADRLFGEAEGWVVRYPELAGVKLRIASHRAEILRARGEPGRARPVFGEVLAQQRAAGDRHGEVVTLQRLARTELDLGRADAGLALAREAQALAGQGRYMGELRDGLYLLADAATAAGDGDAAAGYATRAREMAREHEREITGRKLAQMQAQVQVQQSLTPGAVAARERAMRANWLRNGALAVLAVLAAGALLLWWRGRRRERALAALGDTDPLTALPNRRGADAVLQALVAPGGGRAAVLLVDIDGFKAINDAFGHDVGDRALVAVAGCLRQASDADDLVARWGGEEFLVARGRTTQAAAFALADHLRRQVAQLHMDDGRGGALPLTVSVGVASLPLLSGGGGGWQHAVRAADRALYVAKRAGRNAWAGLWGLEAGAHVDAFSVLDNPVHALAQGWIAIDGNRPMDWSQARPKAGKAPAREKEKAPQRPTDTGTG